MVCERHVHGRAGVAWRAALLASAAVVVLAAVVFSGRRPSEVEMESPPKMVEEMEAEARKDVDDDATKAGLKALSSTNTLAATVTGGLKKQLENMNKGDSELLKKIDAQIGVKTASSSSKAAAKKAVAAKAALAKTKPAKLPPGNRGRDAHRLTPPKPVMSNVVAAVMRDRKHEMMRMSKALARVALLRKQVAAREKEEAGMQHKEKEVVKTVKGQKAVVKVATAKALLIKAGQLKKRAASISKAALFKALPKEQALEKAMSKQNAILADLRNSNRIANSKVEAQKEITQAKTMSQQSIQELKLAGDLIKQSNAVGSKLTAKQTAKLQKKSENLTEKAVHTMLESRKLSHTANDLIHKANAMESQLPALERKGVQASLVLKVLKGQRKADIANLKGNEGYQAAVTLSHQLLSEAQKDHNLAESMLKEEQKDSGAITAAVKSAKLSSSSIIKADQMTASELHHLHLALAAEKKNVEEDDSILSALSPS